MGEEMSFDLPPSMTEENQQNAGEREKEQGIQVSNTLLC